MNSSSRRKGRATPLDKLLALSPDEPLLVAEPDGPFTPGTGKVIVTRRGNYKIVYRKWSKSDLVLRERFPGLQLDYHFREARKYNSPYGAPLRGWVRELLTTAKMHWSREVQAYANGWVKHGGLCIDGCSTNLQFRNWLPGYMDREDYWFWRWGRKFDEAAQIVRIACGLPRFASTRRANP